MPRPDAASESSAPARTSDCDFDVPPTEAVICSQLRFQLTCASAADSKWLCDLLNRLRTPFHTHTKLNEDDSISLIWR
jgi:hypothetical protein